MNGERLRKIREAMRGIKSLRQALTEYYPKGVIVCEDQGRITFVEEGIKYRIAYSKEGLLNNFIEYKNYMKMAYEIKTEVQSTYIQPNIIVNRRVNTRASKYLEKLRIIINNGKEEAVEEINENMDLRDIKDVSIIATKAFFNCKLSNIKEDASSYYFLKKAISEIEKYCIIGNISYKNINKYGSVCTFNEFLELHSEGMELEKIKKGILGVQNDNRNCWKFDFEDFLNNGMKPQWNSRYREYKLDGKSLEIKGISEYQNSIAMLENNFNDLYKLEKIPSTSTYSHDTQNHLYDDDDDEIDFESYFNEPEEGNGEWLVGWEDNYILYT